MLGVILPSMAMADVTIAFPASFISTLQPQAALFSPAITDMLSQLRRERMGFLQRAPANPCLEELRRLHCDDVACLKRSAETLAPACASFLLGPPQPSPAPEGEAEGPKPMAAPSGATGFFSFETSDGDGEVHSVSGPIGAGGSMPPLVASAIGEMFPQGAFPPALSALMGGSSREAASPLMSGLMQEMMEAVERAEKEDEEEEAAMAARHPCAREIDACTRVLGPDAAAARGEQPLKACLVRNMERLSSQCRCFVHQMTAREAATAPRGVPPPAVRAIAVPAGTTAVVVEYGDAMGEPRVRMHPMHQLSCFFLFTSFLFLSMLLVRSCCKACAPKTAKRVVMVPPAKGVIRTHGGHVATIAVEAQPVQVAEPLAKA